MSISLIPTVIIKKIAPFLRSKRPSVKIKLKSPPISSGARVQLLQYVNTTLPEQR